MTTTTKPLFTARFTLVNTSYYTQTQVLNFFRSELEKAGFLVYQSPAIHGYKASFTTKKEGPFEGDDAKSVFETMYIAGPPPDKKELSLAKDLTNDPMGTRPILEQRAPMVTAITWNIAAPTSNITAQQLSDLLWQIRKSKVYNSKTYTGIGWTPLVKPWADAPVKYAPYPDRPAIPSALVPAAPAPKPKPKPTTPVYTPPPPPPPVPIPVVQEKSLLSNWKVWATIGGLLWSYFGE